MTKHTSALILSLTITLALFVYGCCSHSSSGVSINSEGDKIITSREVTIDELGRLPTVTFPSGAKIEGLEENTLTPGIVVTIVEQKTTAQNTALFNNSEKIGVYLYKITAFMNPTNSVKAKTNVTTTEKPIKITLPKPQDSDGIILAGIKESDTDPWRFFNFSDSDEVIANIAGARAVGTNLNDNTFSLFRLGTQFAIVSYDGSKSNKQPETYVTSLNATSTPSILIKDGKYLEDLTIKTLLKGVKLDSINPTDLRVRITYRNNQADEAPIKINGTNVTQTTNADKTVPGYTYWHSFLVDSLSDYSLDGASGEYNFIINLNGIETQNFSNGFLLEFFNKVDSDKILSYNYTEFYKLETREKQDEPQPEPVVEIYSITYNLDDGLVIPDNPTSYSKASETFELVNPSKEGYTFVGWSGTEIDGIASDVSIITGSTGNREYTAHWSENPPDIYTLTLNKGTGIATVKGGGSYEAGVEVTASCTMLKGYEFDSWSGDFTTATITMPEKNVTMTAKARPIIYNIAYQLDGGRLPDNNPTKYDITSATINLNNPTKDGYNFAGWTGSNGDKPQQNVTIEKGSTGDKTYTAHWSAVAYTISYNLDGGRVTPANPTGYNIASETFLLVNPTKDGYSFTGWSGTGLTGNENLSVTIPKGSTGNREYTANWNINSYKLELIAGAGINTVTGGGMLNYNSSITASCTILPGYEFDKWTDLDGNEVAAVFTMPEKNVTMRANAKPINYNIVYNLNGGSVVSANPESYDVTSATIILNNPTRTGCDFIGWSGTGLTGSDSTEVTIPDNYPGNKEYVANWNLHLSLDIASNPGCLIDEEKVLFYSMAGFTITPTVPNGATITDSEKAQILGAIFVKDSADNTLGDNILQKSWDNDKISLSFSKDLEASTTYTISCNTIPGVTLASTPSLTFKTFYFKGKGTENIPYQVENAQQLDFIRNYQDKYFKQTEDISIASFNNWSPIGDDNNPFTGTYDGNTKKISNLTINADQNLKYVGLFGCSSGSIKNMVIEGFSIMSNYQLPPNFDFYSLLNLDLSALGFTGIIVGFNTGEITDCSAIGNPEKGGVEISGKCLIGGICGGNNGSIDSCHVTASTVICGQCNFMGCNGGICGGNLSNITSCYVTSSTIQSNPESEQLIISCGLCGLNYNGNIVSCYVYDSIIQGNEILGNNNSESLRSGICGFNLQGSITSCYIDNSSVTGNAATGICLENMEGSISSCYVINSTIKGDTTSGICYDSANSRISSCYVANSIIQSDSQNQNLEVLAAGICGMINSNDILTSCYVINSTIKAKSQNQSTIAGGICSKNSGDIVSCYVKDSTIESDSQIQSYVGGICGENNGYINSCYFLEDDTHSIICNNEYTGQIIGWNSYGGVTDCFTNKSSDLIGKNEGDSNFLYDGVTNYSAFSSKVWSDGLNHNNINSVWKNYRISESAWPPDLKALPRQ